MLHETINLAQLFPTLAQNGSEATLTFYARQTSEEISASRIWPAVLICPGGGYSMTSDREAEPIALEFLKYGLQCFVLRYTCAPAHYPLQLQEAAAAMAFIRQKSTLLCVDPKRVAVMGFSAGGHLAGSLALLWDTPEVCDPLSLHASQTRPDALCLGYPVITSGAFAHRGSFDCLLGEAPDEALLQRLSLENSVRADMPPVFLWHTAEDDCVPVENSLLFALALRKQKVPFELHIYPLGGHGLSLATMQTQVGNREWNQLSPEISHWPALCEDWLTRTWLHGLEPLD